MCSLFKTQANFALAIGLILLTLLMVAGCSDNSTGNRAIAPRASQWFFQNPYPISNDLEDVVLIDEQTGWAVGAKGTLLFTSDGGVNWQQRGRTGASLRAICFPSKSNGWTVGSGGTILHTSDGGARWAPQSSGTNVYLNDVAFVSDRDGWAVGESGTILHTTNGGRVWLRQNSGTDGWLSGVTFVDRRHGWAVGRPAFGSLEWGNVVLRTDDGGVTWSKVSVMTSGFSSLRRVAFVDTLHGTAVGTEFHEDWIGGIIVATADGGRTWQAEDTRGDHWDVVFDGDGVGYMTGSGTWRSLDSGRTWVHLQDSPGGYGIAVRHQLAVTVGWGGSVLRSEDAGAHWQTVSRGSRMWFTSVAAIDAQNVWAVGFDGARRTRDGGVTWEEGPLPPLVYSAVHFLDQRKGWITDFEGTLYGTSDGGESWRLLATGIQTSLFDFCFIDSLEGWVVGIGKISHTTDGGVTWVPVWRGNGPLLESVSFVDGHHGWSVGEGTILHTEDGVVWSAQNSGMTGGLWDIQFVDSLTGWAVGGVDGNSTIIHTDDGGEHWITQRTKAGEYLLDIDFLDSQVGWVSGRGIILSTQDGGRTWAEDFCPAAGEIEGISMFDSEHGWAVGYPGTILRLGERDIFSGH